MSKRKKALVSVIVSNYNNGSYLDECLECIINQTYKNIEIIVVDDGSTDNSLDILKKWEERHSDLITILALPRNTGFAGAVSTGLYMANGEYIAMQDSDDMSDPKRIELQVKYLSNNDNIAAVGTNYGIYYSDEQIVRYEENGLKYGVDSIKEVYSLGGNCVCYGSLMVKGDTFDKVGALTRRIEGAEDYEFITKFIPYGLDNINEVLYYYRRHSGQRSLNYYGNNNRVKANSDLSILMVIDSMNLGGTETHVYSLVKELINEKVNVSILSGEGPLSNKFRLLGCKIHNMEFPVRITNDSLVIERYKTRISRVIQSDGINLIHAHQSPSGTLALETGRDLGIPTVFTIHGLYYQDIVNDKLKLFSKLISVSIPVYEWLLKFNIQSRVIANGVEFVENLEEGIDVRKELGILDEEMVVLYCSRLAWGKARACENLIRATRDLRRLEGLKINLIIVGEGPEASQIGNSVERANKIIGKKFIHMVGGKTNLDGYYKAADCVVGTGRVAIEAMAANKPVIATGNDGYFGIVTKENFNEGWKVYFGDHKSKKMNNASFVYEDLRYMYNNLEESKLAAIDINVLAKKLFDSKIIINEIIGEYLTLIK